MHIRRFRPKLDCSQMALRSPPSNTDNETSLINLVTSEDLAHTPMVLRPGSSYSDGIMFSGTLWSVSHDVIKGDLSVMILCIIQLWDVLGVVDEQECTKFSSPSGSNHHSKIGSVSGWRTSVATRQKHLASLRPSKWRH